MFRILLRVPGEDRSNKSTSRPQQCGPRKDVCRPMQGRYDVQVDPRRFDRREGFSLRDKLVLLIVGYELGSRFRWPLLGVYVASQRQNRPFSVMTGWIPLDGSRHGFAVAPGSVAFVVPTETQASGPVFRFSLIKLPS